MESISKAIYPEIELFACAGVKYKELLFYQFLNFVLIIFFTFDAHIIYSDWAIV